LQRIFQQFIESLADSVDEKALHATMANAAAALDLSCFAYLTVPTSRSDAPRLISNYPVDWTNHYLRQHYERLDPVIVDALTKREPFEWGLDARLLRLSKPQQQLFDEASHFGIRNGYTVPIHDARGPAAAVTFVADQRLSSFQSRIEKHGRILQLMGMYFHAHARRKLYADRVVDGVRLSPREFECLEWAARGKSAWETSKILGVSRRTAAFHLDNARAKLGVHSVVQAVARLAASKSNII
jgi:DNA-binding CsgD family transcriptional regulator